jgi:undecaprenyl-diphosphatase
MPVPLATADGFLGLLHSWDTSAFLLLNGLHSPFWDSLMRQVSSPWILVPIHLFLLAAIFRRPGRHRAAALLGLLLFVIAIDLAGAHAIKDAVQRVRPCNVADLASSIHFVGGRRSGAYSFVSTHTAYAFALAGFALFSLRRRRVALVLVVWGAAVGYSRLYVGLHYPGDILGGAVWGIASAALAQALVTLAAHIRWRHPHLPESLTGELGTELHPALVKASAVPDRTTSRS